MAKLYINKDIVADKDKMENWYLTGEDGLSFPDIQNFLSWIDPNDHVIDIEIHSCGGDAVEGYAIYDALRASGKQISCTAVGRCASMATVILLAAAKERRFAYPHAKFLIHKPYMASYDVHNICLLWLDYSLILKSPLSPSPLATTDTLPLESIL